MNEGGPRPVPDDLILPFQIESMAAQGRLVRLGPALQKVLGAHDYPEDVAALLAEAQTVAGLLAGLLKFDGVLTLQTKGDGPVNLMVVDVTNDGGMRGYAQFDAAAIAAAEAGETGPMQIVPRLLGAGHLAVTVDQGPETQRYQGIVPLEGASLADCAHDYLRRSAQIDAAVKVAVDPAAGRAGGILLQRAGRRGLQLQSGETDIIDLDDSWRRAVILLGSCTAEELTDPALHPHDLLYRLFNEDGVRVFERSPLTMRCRCSRARVEQVLKSFPRAEIETMKEGDDVLVTCEFCNADYRFDPAAIDALYAGVTPEDGE